MNEINALLQLGGMGVMAFTVIAVVRFTVPIIKAFGDRLLQSLERQIQTTDRLADGVSTIDTRLVALEQQVNGIRDLITVHWMPHDPPHPHETTRSARIGHRRKTSEPEPLERAVHGR